MTKLKPTYTYTLLPVLARQLRDGHDVPANIKDFLVKARAELDRRHSQMLERRGSFLQQLRSRHDSRAAEPCFECEQRALLYALEALNGLEAYLKTANLAYLQECLADYSSSEHQFELLIRLRKRLPASLQEDLQRAA